MSGLERICCLLVSIMGGLILTSVSLGIANRIIEARYVETAEYNSDASSHSWDYQLLELAPLMWIVFAFLIGTCWTLLSRRNLKWKRKEREGE